MIAFVDPVVRCRVCMDAKVCCRQCEEKHKQGVFGAAMDTSLEYMKYLEDRNAARIAALRPIEPLDVEYDGVKLFYLVQWDEMNRRSEWPTGRPHQFTPDQRTAVSAHWSTQLRAKVAASKAAERNVVTYCEED